MDLAKVVVAALLHIVFALGLAAGGYGVWYVDHRPPVDFLVPAPARWVLPAAWKHVRLEGLEAQRDAQKARADGLAAQLTALTAQSQAKVAAAQQVAEAAQASARKAQAKGRAVLVVKRDSSSACAFAQKVDQAFTSELQP